MSKEYNFQKELKKSIFGCDPNKFNRNELLEDVFKAYVAKLFEWNLSRKKQNRLEVDALVEIKRNLISEFRKAELGEYQKSTEWYENLFESTVQEIFNDAAKVHQGIDNVSIEQTLRIDPRAYINEGGLFVPEHLKKG